MPSLSVPPHLIQYIAAPSTSQWQAAEALEEWIWQRRSKGDTLFQVSVGLLDLEDRAPHKTPAFDRARYLTNIPHPTQLTPPDADSSRASASPVTILHHLVASPFTIERSREVILEYVLARETKLRDKRPGRGGKGTLDREGLEDIGERLGEVEAGLKSGLAEQDLDENRQSALALILSLRMSLSYFTLPALARQLLVLAVPDAERVLVQHIRRRVEGAGRCGVGEEIETLERLTASRPSLRPAYRSAKARTTLPAKPISVPFPAPGRSTCIKLITNNTAHALEIVTEYLSRERREYMLKCKWAIKGREALGKDLGDIESATCLVKGAPSPQAPDLIPVFLVSRRTFLLPPSPLPLAIIEPYFDILPAPPEDEFREPSISSTTASLYVNPRLDDVTAMRILEELVEAEREKDESNLADLIDQVEKRFPDGSYAAVFAQARNAQPIPHAILDSPRKRQNSLHTRSLSSDLAVPPRRHSHARSVSLPDADAAKPVLPSIITDQPFSAFLSPTEIESNGWWDVVSAVGSERSPFRSSFGSPEKSVKWRSSLGTSPERIPEDAPLTLPPGAAPASPIGMSSFASMSLLPTFPDTSPDPEPDPTSAPHPDTSPDPTSPPHTPARPPPIPLVFDRPNFPSPTEKDKSPGTRSKLATFGRTMSMRRKRDDGKENRRGKGAEPERWNRDMVASIMGQPADRRE